MIVVEGPDGAGKSTLARELSKRYGFPIAGTRGPSDNVRERVYHAIGEAVKGKGPIRIYDRLFFSELVYGPLLRHKCLFNSIEQKHVLRTLAAIQCPIIFCLPTIEVCQRGMEDREHLEGVRENLGQIYNAYMRYYRLITGPQWMMYAYTQNGIKNWAPIEDYIDKRRERTWD